MGEYPSIPNLPQSRKGSPKDTTATSSFWLGWSQFGRKIYRDLEDSSQGEV